LLARTNKLNYFVNMGKYGLCGKLIAAPGKRQELIAIMARAVDRVGELAGCLLYIVSEDLGDKDAIWVTELWNGQDAHTRSLEDDRVRQRYARIARRESWANRCWSRC